MLLLVCEILVTDPGFDTLLHYLVVREACLLRRINKMQDVYHNAVSYNFRTSEVIPVVNFKASTTEEIFLQSSEN